MINREDARKKYPMRRIVAYALRDMRLMGFRYYGFMVIDIIIQAAVPFLLILLPAEVVRKLQSGVALTGLLAYIAIWITGIFILNLLRTYTHHALEKMSEHVLQVQYERKLEKKLLSCKITDLEDTKEHEFLREVKESLAEGDGIGKSVGVVGLYLYLISLAVNVLGFLLYAAFSSGLSPWLFLVLFLTSVINYFGKSKAIRYQFKHIGAFWENNSKFWYMKTEAIRLEKAKDIRMYGLRGWFQNALSKNTKEATGYYNDIQKHYFYSNLVIRITAIVRDVFCYGFLIFALSSGSIEITGFLLYLGIVSGFGTWVAQIVEGYTYLRKICDRLTVCFACFDEADADQEEREEKVIEIPERCEKIIFEDVSFGYGEKMVFEHFSLTLYAGEKIALVGVNGAGKTTLMKLLCGLYPIREGRILVDGKDIKEIPRKQYFRYLSILFQDVKVFPFSIAKNISCAWNEEEKENLNEKSSKSKLFRAFIRAGDAKQGTGYQNKYDEKRVVECLKQVKLWEKVNGLKNGINTNLTKILDPVGISLSGGESQRLMLARALYKKAPILILDEPTAALDPIAESELYEEYAKLCEGKISIFISHRLSSTRFCDRILFLEGGKILEQGNHDSLMKQNGRYAGMYQIQAHYYQKEVEKHEAGI